MEDKIRKEIEELVKNIFSEKEEADVRQRTSDALETSAQTIEELTDTLEGKMSEVAEAEAKISDLSSQIQELEAQLEAAKAEVTEKVEGLEKANKEIEDMKKDKAMDLRMSELETAGVIRANKEAQATKVREMSDEEFAAYKEELVSIRESVMTELSANKEEEDKKAAEKAAEEAAQAEEAAKAAEEAAKAEGDNAEDTPEAKIDPSQKSAAALNFEAFPAKEITEKYAKLGQAMASMFSTKRSNKEE